MKNRTNNNNAILSEKLGMAVIVDNKIVAWFANFTEDASEWCTRNFFGEWLIWKAKEPKIVPLTKEEFAEAVRKADELVSFFESERLLSD